MGFPLQCPWSPSIMTTEHLYRVPEHRQQDACSVSHLSLLPAGYDVSPWRIEQCLGRHRQGLWDQLGDRAPGVETGQRMQHQQHLYHHFHLYYRPLDLLLTFPLLNFSLSSLSSFLPSSFSIFPIFLCGPPVTDAESLTSFKTALAGLQFNHCNTRSKGQTVGSQWAAAGSILIISLNDTGHH